jgi:hypothetical protein
VFAVVEIVLMTLICRRGVKLMLLMAAGLVVFITFMWLRKTGFRFENLFSIDALVQYMQPYTDHSALLNKSLIFGLGPGALTKGVYHEGRYVSGYDSPIMLYFIEIGIIGTLSWLGYLVRCGFLIWRQGVLDFRKTARVGMDQLSVVVALLIALLDSSFQASVFAWAQTIIIVMAILGVTLRLTVIRSGENLC